MGSTTTTTDTATTDTTPTETEPADATAEHVAAGHVQLVDPATLTLDTNIRTDARLDEPFLDSIRSLGILVPIQVRTDPLGQLLIVDGQRRYLAAQQLELQAVPVVVVHGIGDDESRIRDQFHLNEHRSGLTRTERAAAVEQMALFGRTPATIARTLGAPREEVDAVLTVAKSEPVKELVATCPEVDLLAAAKIAEFGDDPEALADLTATAQDEPDYLDHQLEQWRRQREGERLRAEKVAELTADGVHVLDTDTTALGLFKLAATPRDPDQAPPPELTVEEHATCPHRAVKVDVTQPFRGEPTVYVLERCTAPAAAGHHLRFPPRDDDPSPGSEQTEEEQAAAATEERRRVRANNAASDAARAVRERFIREDLTARKKLPDDALQHAVLILETEPSEFTSYGTAQNLDAWKTTIAAAGKSAREATKILLTRALAAGEHALQRDFWRHPAREAYYTDGPEVRVLHLQALARWGYTLSAVEQEWLDAATGKAAA